MHLDSTVACDGIHSLLVHGLIMGFNAEHHQFAINLKLEQPLLRRATSKTSIVS
jgi:hypothetical protein